jgi:hypothetical protein
MPTVKLVDENSDHPVVKRVFDVGYPSFASR